MRAMKFFGILLFLFSMSFFVEAAGNYNQAKKSETFKRIESNYSNHGAISYNNFRGYGWHSGSWCSGNWNTGDRFNGGGHHGGGHGGGAVGAPLDGSLLILLGMAGLAYYLVRKRKIQTA